LTSQGIRGLASFTVVITHLARSFDDKLFLATSAEKTAPRVLQWPIVRVFIHGRIGVAIFALVTGYVCALKPIRQAKANNPEGALVSVAKSAFRRVPRLVLPTCIATAIVWTLAQLGVFVICKSTNSHWLNTTAPDRQKTITGAAKGLFNALTFTWTKGINSYDPNQWTLEPLLKGSMFIYITLFATVYMQPKYRMMTSLSMWVYYYFVGDGTLILGLRLHSFLCVAGIHTEPLTLVPSEHHEII
jgi:peptidoglycan/LPS O-acetylase OafA/YrhL